MNLFRLIQQHSRFFYLYLAVFAFVNSVMASSLLHFINTKLAGDSLPYFADYELPIFAVILLVSLFVSYKFEMYMLRVTEQIGVDMIKHVFAYLNNAEYERFLKLKEERVRTALLDISRLQGVPYTYIGLLNNIIMVVIGMIYMFMSNLIATSLLLLIVGLTASYFVFKQKSIQKDKNTIRDLIDDFMRVLNDFLQGFRELKMSMKRSDNIVANYLEKIIEDQKFLKLRYLAKIIKNKLLGQYAVYIIIGIILFILPIASGLDAKSMIVFVTTFLFIAGPITGIVEQLDALGTITISMERLDEFEKILQSNKMEDVEKIENPSLNQSLQKIKFRDVCFEYLNKDVSSKFKLDQINIEINRGEVIFITGGNGSGKSTFINLLTGLFKPTEGKIYYNDHLLTEEDYTFYRNKVSCIFTNNYFFSENYDEFDFSQKNKTFWKLLEEMKLSEVAHIDNEKNKVSSSLSKGQQKRLLLIYSLLENKELIVFDEWAAEQDPEFRKYFYHEMIPYLKKLGKTVVAITHDDAYFDFAERMIKFEYGKIIKDELIKNKEPIKIKELR